MELGTEKEVLGDFWEVAGTELRGSHNLPVGHLLAHRPGEPTTLGQPVQGSSISAWPPKTDQITDSLILILWSNKELTRLF